MYTGTGHTHTFASRSLISSIYYVSMSFSFSLWMPPTPRFYIWYMGFWMRWMSNESNSPFIVLCGWNEENDLLKLTTTLYSYYTYTNMYTSRVVGICESDVSKYTYIVMLYLVYCVIVLSVCIYNMDTRTHTHSYRNERIWLCSFRRDSVANRRKVI